jgi:hypothetical protein
MAEKKEQVKLKSTDTPNVAQVMYLIREYHEYRRPTRRIVRFFRNLFRSNADRQRVEASNASIDKATRAKKAINAAGQVVDVLE